MRTVLLVSTALFLLAGCGDGAGGRRFLSIGTGGTGGIYYPLGGALAARLSVADSTRQYTAEVTGGSVENVKRVIAGQIDLGFTLSVTAYEAFNGGQDFPTPATDLRIVAPLYPNLTHVLVRRGAPIRGLAGLRDRTVSVGSAGSGTEQVSRQLLEAAGLSYDDVDERFLTFTESAAALRDGAIDAAILSVGYPAAAVLEATTTGDVRLLPIGRAQMEALRRAYPYHGVGEIPAGAYPGVDEPVPTVAMMNWIVGRESLDAGVVTGVLNILGEERVSLEQVHEMAGQVDVAALDDAPIPLHPAARAWLAERVAPGGMP